MWVVDQTAELVRDAKQINNGFGRWSFLIMLIVRAKDNDAAPEALGGVEDIELAPFKIVRRKAFPNAAASGLSVLEYDDPKAISELNSLLESLAVFI